MKKSKVTTEDLARMVQGGFDDLSGRMEKGFTEVKEWQRLADGKFDAIEMELMDIKVSYPLSLQQNIFYI